MSIDTFLLSADTIDLNYPEVRPTLDLNFARVKALDPRITFTRASGGSYVGADGLIKLAGVNEARFDHDPVTGESLGLLVEEARTNLLVRSEDFSINSFTSDILITTNTITSPDGNTTADTLTANINGGSNTCFVDKNPVISSSTDYTYSVFLKAGTSPKSTANFYFTGGTFRQAVLEITWGTTPTTSLSTTGGTTATSSLVAYPNGWYRAIITYDSGNNTGAVSRVYVRDQGTSNVVGHTVHVWGAQLEAGSFPTSYIPTEGSTRTRAADDASITGKNFSEWYRQDEGTIYCNAKGVNNLQTLTRRYWEISSSSSGRLLAGYPNLTQTRFLVIFFLNNFTQADLAVFNQTPGLSFIKTASTFGNNYFRTFSNGSLGATDDLGSLPNIEGLRLGADVGNTDPRAILNGHISRFTYFPKRLPNAQLQALTR